ncbi:hypothetical protein Trco_001722 [Trichoderma cornu-damae]|uniref:CUE domain-containing protein n=1 Tax=Trichoderma cornu-damae TaxID=654480 RepID=A0A9P8TUD8_9HYPO|nr:hypothetical protein Trco_001722 [Trichoderma cornu-damae]
MPRPNYVHATSQTLALPSPPVNNTRSRPPSQATRDACRQSVMEIFADISPEYLEKAAETHGYDANKTINYIADQEELGMKYPRRQRMKGCKRKRGEYEDMEEEMREAKHKYGKDERKAHKPSSPEREKM